MDYNINYKEAIRFLKKLLKNDADIVREANKTIQKNQRILSACIKADPEKAKKEPFSAYKSAEEKFIKFDKTCEVYTFFSYWDCSHPHSGLTIAHVLYNQLRNKKAHTHDDQIIIATSAYQKLVDGLEKLFPVLEDNSESANTSCPT